MTQPRMLVVEDDEVMRRVLLAVFQRRAETRVVGTAHEARQALVDFTADLVLSDNAMPGESGLTFLRGLAASGHGAKRFLFSATEPDDLQHLLGAGVLAGFLRKPASVDELLAILRA